MKVFNLPNKLGEESFACRYAGEMDGYFTLLSEKQLKDEELWSLLVKQFSNRYDENDEGWRGEYWGKLMRGASLVYAYTKDEELYRILTNTVEHLLLQVDEAGRISSYPPHGEFIGWDLWGRKYVMLGLEYYYEICRYEHLKERILRVLLPHADYITERVGEGEGKRPVNQTSKIWGAINSVSMIQPFVKLYRITGQEKYLRYAEELIKSQEVNGVNIFQTAFENKRNPYEYPVTKAYELISCFEGLLDYYVETGNKKCLKACKGFADRLLKTDFTIVGGSGCKDEYFDHSTKKQVLESAINKQETCVTVTLIKYLTALYKVTDEVAYVDAIERAFLNLYLGALGDGEVYGRGEIQMFYSYSPLFLNPRWTLMGGNKNISTYARFGCCVAIGAAGAGEIPTLGVMGNADGITVNFYYAGDYRLQTAEGEVALRIDTAYPKDGRVDITLLSAPKGACVRLRMPAWCSTLSLMKENEPCAFNVEKGYIYVADRVEAGETLTVSMQMSMQVCPSHTVNEEMGNLFALTRGPIVLCADSAETDLRKEYALRVDERGYALYEQREGGYAIALQDGTSLFLREYRSCGKDMRQPRDISVWLFSAKK